MKFKSSEKIVLWAIVGLSVAIFILDLFGPRGMAVWLFYVVPLSLTCWTARRPSPLVFATVCTGLTVLGALLSPPDVPIPLTILNCTMGVAVFWILAWLLTWRMRTETALRADEGRCRAVVEDRPVGRDITERQQTEAALRESESMFRSLSTCSPVGIFITDQEGNMTYANPVARRILGLGLMEVVGEGWARAVHPEDRERAMRDWRAAVRAHKEFSGEFRIVTSPGVERWCHARAARMLSESGEMTGYAGTVEDITERRRAEAALRELSRRLLKAEDDERRRIAKELHDSTAQDLVAAMMSLDSVRESIADRAAPEARQLEDSLAVLEKCAHDIRTLSYVLHPPHLDEVGLAGAIRHYTDGFAGRTGIAMTLELPEDLGRLDEDVELVLFRAVQECLGNILRHAHSPTAAIRLTRDASATVLEIRDAGCGIPPAVLEAAEGSGSGLGVGIAGMRERLRQIGGRLEIESGSCGTTMRAILPRQQEAP